jgi:hypothetical protein
MKRFLLGLALVVGLASTSIATAATVSGYATGSRATAKAATPSPKMAASTKTLGAKYTAAGYYPTDITIQNDTPYYLYFTLAGSGIENPIPPGAFGFVTHPYEYSDVHLVIQDEHLFPINGGDMVVCSQAQIRVISSWRGEILPFVNTSRCGW